MSLTSSLSNALSGLTASSRAAQLVSTNVANAMTEGFGRREIVLAARTLDGAGAGVNVDGVTRAVDQAVVRDRRLSDASVAADQSRVDFQSRIGALFGTPGAPGSLSDLVSDLEAALIEAGSRPDSETRLAAIAASASRLSEGLGRISDGIQEERLAADRAIALQAQDLNTALEEVAEINALILRLGSGARDVTGLLDQRQQVIDRISSIVPVREVPRDNGAVALFTTGGAVLLDGRPAVLSFAPVATVTPDMTLAGGGLSGLEINGRPVAVSGRYSPIGGGSLAAAFDIRDRLAVDAQSGADAFARVLVEAFQTPAVDSTLLPGDAGLFTDRGAAFDPVDEIGLAGRLWLNPAVDPAAGGDLWKLRAGLGAAAPGAAGDGTLLSAMAAALLERRPAPGAIGGPAQALNGLAAELQSRAAREGLDAETALGFEATRRDSLLERERAGGVDTDQEMQKLLLIEKTYAANARVVQTIDQLLGALLEI